MDPTTEFLRQVVAYWVERCESAEAALEEAGGELAVDHFAKWKTLAGPREPLASE